MAKLLLRLIFILIGLKILLMVPKRHSTDALQKKVPVYSLKEGSSITPHHNRMIVLLSKSKNLFKNATTNDLKKFGQISDTIFKIKSLKNNYARTSPASFLYHLNNLKSTYGMNPFKNQMYKFPFYRNNLNTSPNILYLYSNKEQKKLRRETANQNRCLIHVPFEVNQDKKHMLPNISVINETKFITSLLRGKGNYTTKTLSEDFRKLPANYEKKRESPKNYVTMKRQEYIHINKSYKTKSQLSTKLSVVSPTRESLNYIQLNNTRTTFPFEDALIISPMSKNNVNNFINLETHTKNKLNFSSSKHNIFSSTFSTISLAQNSKMNVFNVTNTQPLNAKNYIKDNPTTNKKIKSFKSYEKKLQNFKFSTLMTIQLKQVNTLEQITKLTSVSDLIVLNATKYFSYKENKMKRGNNSTVVKKPNEEVKINLSTNKKQSLPFYGRNVPLPKSQEIKFKKTTQLIPSERKTTHSLGHPSTNLPSVKQLILINQYSYDLNNNISKQNNSNESAIMKIKSNNSYKNIKINNNLRTIKNDWKPFIDTKMQLRNFKRIFVPHLPIEVYFQNTKVN